MQGLVRTPAVFTAVVDGEPTEVREAPPPGDLRNGGRMTVASEKVSMGVVESHPSHVFDGRAVSVFTEHVLQSARSDVDSPGDIGQ